MDPQRGLHPNGVFSFVFAEYCNGKVLVASVGSKRLEKYKTGAIVLAVMVRAQENATMMVAATTVIFELNKGYAESR
jgi:hypothetical protein